jgi:hypothetical protein
VSGRPRVIVALPDPLEGATVVEWLQGNNFDPVYRTNPAAAAAEMQRPFNLLIAEATWAVGTALQSGARARNPIVPTILIGDAMERRATAVNAQTMYMTRPIEMPVLSCFVSMALIVDDRPVRRSPRKSVQRFEALVNGLPSGIVNVSAEGLRLELPRDRRAALPPYFAVRVPLVGVAVIAKRRWMMSASQNAPTLWCGAALSHNRASSEERWRAFVDSVPIVGDKNLRVTA